MGIPQSTISRIENGTMDPPYSKFKKIYEFLENESRKKKQAEMTAGDIMTDNIISIKPKSSIKEAIELMYDNDISQLPIIEKGQNLGSITSKKIQKEITDVLRIDKVMAMCKTWIYYLIQNKLRRKCAYDL